MAIGVWEPGKKQEPAQEVELQQLQRFIRIARDDRLGELDTALDPDDLRRGAALMKLEQASWSVAQELSSEELELLIRFFTRAEMDLPGWEGGKQSPVIWLVRILRERDLFTAELRRWIKANSDNRYLPYGSVL